MKPKGDILEMKSETESVLIGSRKDWIDPRREVGSRRILMNFQAQSLERKKEFSEI